VTSQYRDHEPEQGEKYSWEWDNHIVGFHSMLYYTLSMILFGRNELIRDCGRRRLQGENMFWSSGDR
jgi:hypothetical protein